MSWRPDGEAAWLGNDARRLRAIAHSGGWSTCEPMASVLPEAGAGQHSRGSATPSIVAQAAVEADTSRVPEIFRVLLALEARDEETGGPSGQPAPGNKPSTTGREGAGRKRATRTRLPAIQMSLRPWPQECERGANLRFVCAPSQTAQEVRIAGGKETLPPRSRSKRPPEDAVGARRPPLATAGALRTAALQAAFVGECPRHDSELRPRQACRGADEAPRSDQAGPCRLLVPDVSRLDACARVAAIPCRRTRTRPPGTLCS